MDEITAVKFVIEWNLNRIVDLSTVGEVDYYKVMMNINDLKNMKTLEINKSAMTSYSLYRYWYDNWMDVIEVMSNTLSMLSLMRTEELQVLSTKVNMHKVMDGLDCLHTHFVKRNDKNLMMSVSALKRRLDNILSPLKSESE